MYARLARTASARGTRAVLDTSGPALAAALLCPGPSACAEFAVPVPADCKRQGIGSLRLGKMVACCRARGARERVGILAARL
ncbi:Protein acetyltransferase [Cupriavidus basilensis]|uniref:Protein acetyltransferase n=1 Tax=Cupriavidus basilensis TaxID=68895 RepID=A0A0C4Y9Y1_9BURK|nr:hypothetical protein [Cupriavidus basilensis]AJG19755.1 Protein acetyltransferase [Cupriavidus basilensis]